MSLRVGLGASQADLDVQGEIDFDFFEETDCTSNSNKNISTKSEASSEQNQPNLELETHPPKENLPENGFDHNAGDPDLYSDQNLQESGSSPNFNKPVITISCDDVTGMLQKNIETIIPTPFNYKDNKCGGVSPSLFKKSRSNVSSQSKKNFFKDDNDSSDDSSISSMSDSLSYLSSVSEDSFELDETDSMTDVSPLASPYCYTPTPEFGFDSQDNSPRGEKDLKKEGVKFTEDIKTNICSKCDSIDFQELVNAMNCIKIKQNSVCSVKCKSPILTQNARCRKNLSFTNEEVRKIDNDNQVLLRKIVAQQNRSKSNSIAVAPIRSSSAVNRQRLQRQIDLENLALLKRLESTKPTKTLSRTHLLQDYSKRTSGLISRASSRCSLPSCSSLNSMRPSTTHTSGRASAITIKSPSSSGHSALFRMHSSKSTLYSN